MGLNPRYYLSRTAAVVTGAILLVISVVMIAGGVITTYYTVKYSKKAQRHIDGQVGLLDV